MDTSKIINGIIKGFEDLKTEKSKLNNELKEIDKFMNDYYHIVELVDLPASKLSKLTRIFKDKVRRCRLIKDKMSIISHVLSSKNIGVEKIEERANQRNESYRQEALKNIERVLS